MTQATINIGTIPNDGTGDPLREAFDKTNLNFDEVYATGVVDGSIRIGAGAAASEISTADLNANITVKANGTGIIILDTDTIRVSTQRTIADLVNGAAGDVEGDICWDATKIYVCVSTFGVSTPVWKSVALA